MCKFMYYTLCVGSNTVSNNDIHDSLYMIHVQDFFAFEVHLLHVCGLGRVTVDIIEQVSNTTQHEI